MAVAKKITSKRKPRKVDHTVDRKRDMTRTAKRCGWRYKGGRKGTPTLLDIMLGKAYYEDRVNRCDVDQRTRLKKGGRIGAFGKYYAKHGHILGS